MISLEAVKGFVASAASSSGAHFEEGLVVAVFDEGKLDMVACAWKVEGLLTMLLFLGHQKLSV